MFRKSCWLAAGLLAFCGCNTNPPEDVNNTVPPSPPGIEHVKAPPPPGARPQAPSDYPGLTPGPGAGATEAAKPEAAKGEEAKPEAAKGEEPKSEAAAEGEAKLSDEEIAEIKKLPAADQAAALAQKVCPVSDEHLGEMGPPVKVTAGGATFFLCCKNCNKELKDEAKVKEIVAKLTKK
jgi:hypothetical protein